MKIILRFPQGDKIKEIPLEIPPEKIAWTLLDPEMHSLIANSAKDKQVDLMQKYGEKKIIFELTENKDGDMFVYLPSNL